MQHKTTKELIYPPNPKADKKKLLQAGRAYQWQIFLVMLGLVLFWLIYFGLITLTGLGLYWYWELPMIGHIRYGIFLKAGGLAIGVMFLVFLLKFLFKKFGTRDENMVEIKEKTSPNFLPF